VMHHVAQAAEGVGVQGHVLGVLLVQGTSSGVAVRLTPQEAAQLLQASTGSTDRASG
jgi:hypothetical protein